MAGAASVLTVGLPTVWSTALRSDWGDNEGYTERELTREQQNRLTLIDYWGRYKNIANVKGAVLKTTTGIRLTYRPNTWRNFIVSS